MLEREPNPAHHALAAIERWHTARGGRFLLVTQNVDPLHERAGSERLVKVHGSADRVRCSRHRCVHGAPSGSLPRAEIDMRAFKADPVAANVPRCPSCGALLRQHVLWFDEFYDEHRDYQWDRVLDAAQGMDACLFAGTSFSVGVTDLFPPWWIDVRTAAARHRPGCGCTPHSAVTLLREPSEALLPEVCEMIGAECAIWASRRVTSDSFPLIPAGEVQAPVGHGSDFGTKSERELRCSDAHRSVQGRQHIVPGSIDGSCPGENGGLGSPIARQQPRHLLRTP